MVRIINYNAHSFVDYTSIIISRFDKSHDPIVVVVPIEISKEEMITICQANSIQPFNTRKEEDSYRFCKPPTNRVNALYELMHEYDSLQAASSESMGISKLMGSDMETKLWWKRREAVDERIKHLLLFVEYAMFRCWKVLLAGEVETELRDKLQMASETLAEEIRSRLNQNMSPHLIALTLSSLYTLTESELEDILCQTLEIDRETHRDQINGICRRFYEVFCSMFTTEEAVPVSSPPRAPAVQVTSTPVPASALPLVTPVRSRNQRAATTTRKRKEVIAPTTEASDTTKRVRRKRVVGMALVKQLAKTNGKILRFSIAHVCRSVIEA
jgi:hypothetical protein